MHKGWVEQKGERFSILRPGREFRQGAETLTDEFFYRPWNILSEKELVELKNLLKNIFESCEIKS